jgi:hypothetical protein
MDEIYLKTTNTDTKHATKKNFSEIQWAKWRDNVTAQLKGRAEELRDLQQKFDAPMHFPELHTGITYYALSKLLLDMDKSNIYCRYWLNKASHDLYQSQQSYTMRAKYYDNISNLYYLYDDFNDRQRHYNHAIQMLGANRANQYIKKISSLISALDTEQYETN